MYLVMESVFVPGYVSRLRPQMIHAHLRSQGFHSLSLSHGSSVSIGEVEGDWGSGQTCGRRSPERLRGGGAKLHQSVHY